MKTIITLLIFILLLSKFFVCVNAQPLTFSKVYYDAPLFGIEGRSVVRSYDSGYMIAGMANYQNGLILKIDSAGNIIWNKKFGSASTHLEFNNIINTLDSAFVIAGSMYISTNSTSDAMVIKLNSNGDTLWHRVIHNNNFNLVAHSVQQTNDSGYVVTGSRTDLGLPSRIFISKLDASGNLQWIKIITVANHANDCSSIKQTPDNGYILTGTIEYNLGPSSYEIDAFLIKLDSAGGVTWARKYVYPANSITEGFDVEITNSGFLCLLNNSLIIKTDFLGNVLWNYSYPFGQSNKLHRISDSTYMFIGRDCWDVAVKIDTSGNALWAAYLDFNASDFVESLDKGILFMGNGPCFGVSASRVFSPQIGVIKTDSLGNGQACIYPFIPNGVSDTVFSSIEPFTVLTGGTISIVQTIIDSLIIVTDSGCVDFLGGIVKHDFENNISVSPNPTTTEITITPDVSGAETKIVSVEIYDVMGNEISKVQMAKGKNKIDVAKLSQGIYFVKVKTEKGERVAKFVKQ